MTYRHWGQEDPNDVDWSPVGGYRDAAETAGNESCDGPGSWEACFRADLEYSGELAHKSPCTGCGLWSWCDEDCPNYTWAVESAKAYDAKFVASEPDVNDVPF